jgi:hexosaminidase
MKNLFLFSFVLIAVSIQAQQVNIIPQPVEIRLSESKEPFIINKQTKFVFLHGYGFEKYTDYFNDYLLKYYGFKLQVYGRKDEKIKSNFIQLGVSPLPGVDSTEGKYKLTITKDYIDIFPYRNRTGMFYAFQTLIQLLPIQNQKIKNQNSQLSIPQLSITDYPRFAYRGLHLDVGRHFMPVDFVKKYIDYIALHKMNYFHWHLTEDQGWRIEIKKYPKLTEVGAWRNGTIIGRYPGAGNDNTKYGGFYTQEQIKEIVKYAGDRYITVVPEIELPGHSSAAIAAYPYLSCFPDEPTKIPASMISRESGTAQSPFVSGKPSIKLVQETWGVFEDVFCAGKNETFKFLEDVMDEVISLFPGKYIHVGGDECPKENWKRCSSCQARMKNEKLKDEHELQSYFIQRMEKYLNKKGKTLIGWDEILEGGLAPKAIVMSWRGEEGGIAAAKEKHEVIMTPGDYVYLNNSQSENEDSVSFGGYLPLEKVYNYEPVPAALNNEEANYVFGAQGNIWTEYMKYPTTVEYMIFPRLAALSEVLWSPKANRNWNDFEKRLKTQFNRYELWRANYSKAYYDLKAAVLPTENNKGVLWKLETKQDSVVIKYITHAAGNAAAPKFSEGKIYTSPLTVQSTMITAAIGTVKGKTISNPVHQTFLFNKATGKKITLNKAPAPDYPGDGAFTLVNGVQNEKGLAKSKEYLGFLGTNCEAIIDLDSVQKIKNVLVHALRQESSWIWRPLTLEVFVSDNGTDFTSVGLTDDFNAPKTGIMNGTMKVEFAERRARYIKIVVERWGEIPQGNPGAGSKAWLFVDEIEVN